MKMKSIAVVLLAATALTACVKVDPGHVGIKVNQFGSDRGVAPETLSNGVYFQGIGTRIVEYPIFTQTYTFTSSHDEGKTVNEEMPCQTIEGTSLSTDIGVSYSIDPVLASTTYQKYRNGMEEILSGPIRNEIRNAMTNVCATYKVDEAYGPKKSELLNKVEGQVQTYFKPYGVRVEHLFWAGKVRAPENIEAQINAKIANEQNALAEQAKVQTVEAQARQKVAEAEGEAKAIQLRGDALRQNPASLQLRAIEAWEKGGSQMPTYWGGGGSLPFIANISKGEK